LSVIGATGYFIRALIADSAHILTCGLALGYFTIIH